MLNRRKKILITGCNGLLGQKIVNFLASNSEVKLIATSKGANRNPIKEEYTYKELDITDNAATKNIITHYKPDVVINTAAMTNVDQCELEKEKCRAINVDALANLVKVCEETNSHIISLSTDFIFDGANGPYKEDDAPNPLSYYAESKLASEKLLIDSNADWTIIRTILVYGVVEDMSRSNIVLWAKESLEQQKEIFIVTDQIRMPTLAEDLAMGCILAAMKHATGIYHVSGKNAMSIYEMVIKIAEFWELNKSLIKPINSETYKVPARRPLKTGFVLNKAMKELGYVPRTFTEGLKVVDQQLKKIKNMV